MVRHGSPFFQASECQILQANGAKNWRVELKGQKSVANFKSSKKFVSLLLISTFLPSFRRAAAHVPCAARVKLVCSPCAVGHWIVEVLARPIWTPRKGKVVEDRGRMAGWPCGIFETSLSALFKSSIWFKCPLDPSLV
eukprot:s4891_g6.t1